MLCSNDPAALGRLAPEDNATVEWFRDWLCWQSLPADDRALTPEPQAPGYHAQVVMEPEP